MQLNLVQLGLAKGENGQYAMRGLEKSLKADDLGKVGSIIKAIIVDAEQVQFAEESKVMVSMKLSNHKDRKEGRLALNKTNLVTLCNTLGDNTDKWVGAEVELRVESTLYQGQKTPCIRVYA